MNELIQYVQECIQEGTKDTDAHLNCEVSESTYRKLKFLILLEDFETVANGTETINGAYVRLKKEQTKRNKAIKGRGW